MATSWKDREIMVPLTVLVPKHVKEHYVKKGKRQASHIIRNILMRHMILDDDIEEE